MDDDVDSQETEQDNGDNNGSNRGGKLGVTDEDQSMNLTLYVLVPIATLIICIYCGFLFFSKRKQDTYVRIIPYNSRILFYPPHKSKKQFKKYLKKGTT